MSGVPETGLATPEFVRTSGRSMWPLIRHGALIALRPATPETVTPGEIVAFRRDGRLFAHRLLAVRRGAGGFELREKGDHNRGASWIEGDRLVGAAVELREGPCRRSLGVDPRGRRIRWLTALLRLEADLVERWIRVRLRGGAPARLRPLLLPAALLLAPARALLVRLLLTAYPRPTTVEDAGALVALVRSFRALFPGARAEGDAEAGTVPGDGVALIEAAAAHGLVPSLVAVGSLPPTLARAVRRQSYRTALDHERAKPALRSATRALDAAGVPYAVLKGPALYEAFYRDRFPRAYCDLDLLVPRDRIEVALAALAGAGYAVEGGARRQAFLRRFHFHLALTSPRPGWPPIELHWALVDRANLYRLPADAGLARRQTLGAGDDAFAVLEPGDALLYLCLHVAKHAPFNANGLRRGVGAEWFIRASVGNRLLWFADIALLLERAFDRFDWPELRRRARDWNTTEDVGVTLRVLHLLAPGSRAGAALERLGLPAVAPVRMRRRAWSGAGPAPEWALRMNPVVLFRPIRVLLAFRLLFPPPGRLLAYYAGVSRWRLPLLVLVHPFHMAGRLLRK